MSVNLESKKYEASRRYFILAAPFVAFGTRSLIAQEAGSVITEAPSLLTIDGDISKPERGDVVVFDQAQLDSLPQVAFNTTTIWTEGVQLFSGPLLHDLLEAVGAGTGDVTATAINDYAVDISRSEITPQAPIVASRLNGMPFSVRNKGPLWIVFPYDSDPSFRSELVYAMSVWQLEKLTVLRA